MPPVQSPHASTPSQQSQEAEAVARAASGAEPGLSGAADVVDDAAPGGDDLRPATPAPEQRPAPPVRSNADTKRADIIARFRTSRTADAEDARDDISDFARSGMPPEFEPPAPDPVIDDQRPAPAEPAPAARPQMVKVKVNGVEREVPLEEALGKAQIAYASENILDEVKALKRELNDTLRGSQQAPRAGQADQHQVRSNGAQTTEVQPPAADTSGDPDTTDDPITKLIETLQFGDPTEARTLLQNTIAVEARKEVRNQLQTDRLRDEGARSQKVLADFLGQHADIAADPRAKAVIEYNVFEQQLADLQALGIDPNKIRTGHGGPPTPADIAQAHRWYRSEGFGVKSPKEMLEKAVSEFETWRGVKPTNEPVVTERAAPRIEVTVDRSARRETIPQQPSRTAMPQQGSNQPAAPQPRDRSDIVASMAAKRGMPRGKVAV